MSTQPEENLTSDRYLRRHEVEAAVGLKKSAIYHRIAAGTFPAGDRIDGTARRWRASEIARWKAEHITQLDG